MRQKSTEDVVKGAEDVMHKAGTANERTAKDAMKGAEEMAHKAGDIAKHAAANNNAQKGNNISYRLIHVCGEMILDRRPET